MIKVPSPVSADPAPPPQYSESRCLRLAEPARLVIRSRRAGAEDRHLSRYDDVLTFFVQ